MLVVPDLEAGNMLAKSLTFLADADAAGIVLGTRAPIILTSRADSLICRLASCAVATWWRTHEQRTPGTWLGSQHGRIGIFTTAMSRRGSITVTADTVVSLAKKSPRHGDSWRSRPTLARRDKHADGGRRSVIIMAERDAWGSAHGDQGWYPTDSGGTLVNWAPRRGLP